MHVSKEKINTVVSLVLSYYEKHGRSFPWRETEDPYCVLVSEYMLQQTQVGRVEDKFSFFIDRFPDVVSLAEADRKDVLLLWSGLGYNRRAIALHEAASVLVDEYGGSVPENREMLLGLPGVGEYTSGAVLVFAYNEPIVIIETNIRTVIFHHYLGRGGVVDAELFFFVEKMLQHASVLGASPKVFYSAMMDYGSHLKSIGIHTNPLSKHYTKQKRFEGSVRQARGELLRFFIAAEKGVSKERLNDIGVSRVEEGLVGLVSDGLIERRGKYYYLS